jgi:hypothetical protein
MMNNKVATAEPRDLELTSHHGLQSAGRRGKPLQ